MRDSNNGVSIVRPINRHAPPMYTAYSHQSPVTSHQSPVR
ncbi:hypothetical protein CKA32_003836 [Geitlerinema sp. FC II]|nr:hypothetical protein CKA32_003836 [Geitlerinema sp. FC II]